MSDAQIATAVGALIRRAREAQRPRLSGRKAADLASLSDARYRQIENGTITVGGHQAAVRAPAGTLARIASVVGVTPEQLRSVGREDAAEDLELELERPAAAEDPDQRAMRQLREFGQSNGLPARVVDEMIATYFRHRRDNPGPSMSNDHSAAG